MEVVKSLKNHSPKTRHNKGQKIVFSLLYNVNFCVKVKMIPQKLSLIISNNYPDFNPGVKVA